MSPRSANSTSRHALFEEWFSHYAKGLLGYAREFVDSQEEAEDIVHDVFVKLWEKMDNISPEAIKTYLFRATKNKSIDYLTHLKVRSKYQEGIIHSGGDPPEALSDDMYIPSQLQAMLDNALDKLTPQQKKVFVMYKLEDRSMTEISAELNISPRTAEKHFELASKFMKNYLSENMYLLLLALLSS